MVFSSALFLFVFLPLVLIGLFLLKRKWQNYFLLIMSLLFYTYGEGFLVLLMISSILINYLLGFTLNYFPKNKKVLFIGVAINLSGLFFYKYTDFFISNINEVFDSKLHYLKVALPIGISFFTFQSISYLVDVYSGRVKYQENPFNLGLYISLFPQLIAGPIVRYKDVNQQITERKINLDKFTKGIKRFIIGLSKKVLIANPMAVIADEVFSLSVNDLSSGVAWLGVLAYTLQIYFDFSGYSDMAIGLGKMLGFDFLENFNFPYVSKSIQEFWRRWHISLSTWFKDYVYIPLGGNRVSNIKIYRNLMIVFFITGFWHGASWNFIVWGLFHGFFIILERNKTIARFLGANSALSHLYTLLIVIIGWVFFRSSDLYYALNYLKALIGLSNGTNYMAYLIFDNYNKLLMLIGIVCSIPISKLITPSKAINNIVVKYNSSLNFVFIINLIALFTLFTLCIMEISKNSYNPFIYFRF